ncbi:MAG: B12-binding domain-containing radical SAM protein, partial [Synergistaceae bacterium]|nr:B12-binding domain-containing radical SAM protein [Synergistaceae bacterium]
MNFDEFNLPEWKLLSQVSRPSRYCCSEWRPHKKISWNDSSLRVCLAFPDVYEIGMSYYGFQIMEQFIHSMNPKYIADRAYCVWPDMEELMRKDNILLASTEHKRPVKDFDILAFTLPHEAGNTNILTMLNLAGINIFSRERNDFPLVIAGGYGAFIPEVMSEFIDVFCVGEAEALLPELLPLIESMKNDSRDKVLSEIAKLKGFYVPLLHNH